MTLDEQIEKYTAPGVYVEIDLQTTADLVGLLGKLHEQHKTLRNFVNPPMVTSQALTPEQRAKLREAMESPPYSVEWRASPAPEQQSKALAAAIDFLTSPFPAEKHMLPLESEYLKIVLAFAAESLQLLQNLEAEQRRCDFLQRFMDARARHEKNILLNLSSILGDPHAQGKPR